MPFFNRIGSLSWEAVPENERHSTTREVIGGKVLTAWQPDQQDADDDSLPDAWQKSYDFDKKDAGLRGAPADIDGDGVSNWDEWKSGKNPLVADAVNTEHLLRCETWLNLAGHRLKDLETDALYPTSPTVSKLIDNMDFSDEGEDYGCLTSRNASTVSSRSAASTLMNC